MHSPTPLINLHGFEAAAADLLPRMVYDYYAGGANDELLLRTSRTSRCRICRSSARTSVVGIRSANSGARKS